MSATTKELVHLIDLSLGAQPSGVVNFNYLHTLMHAIVRHLGTMEHVQQVGDGAGGEITGGTSEGDTVTPGAGGEATATAESTDGVSGTSSGEGGGGAGAKDTEVAKKEASSTSTASTGDASQTAAVADSKLESSGRASRTGARGSAGRPVSSFVTAANDLGAMERKLQELEGRLNAMDTLPELLERKSSDMGATPIKDRWNYTNLTKRLSAVEDGLEQVGQDRCTNTFPNAIISSAYPTSSLYSSHTCMCVHYCAIVIISTSTSRILRWWMIFLERCRV